MIPQPEENGSSCVADTFGAVRLIWMNEPGRRNALSLSLRKALRAEVEAAMADHEIRCIVLTGAGRGFASGGDIESLKDVRAAEAVDRMLAIQELMSILRNGRKPVVAAVEGFAIGAGLSIATSCDLIVTSAQTRFALPFGKIGLLPDLGVLHSLPRRIGMGRTRMMALTGRAITGDVAFDWGLADELAPQGEVVEAALRIADEIAAQAPLSVDATRRVLGQLPHAWSEAMTLEANTQAMLFMTDDFREGARAFLERRPPQFYGK